MVEQDLDRWMDEGTFFPALCYLSCDAGGCVDDDEDNDHDISLLHEFS